MMTTKKQIFDFVNHVFDFYGKGGLYDMGATHKEIFIAVSERLLDCLTYEDSEWDGDTLDRERVRDIIIRNRGQ